MLPKIETIELQHLASGDRLYLQIYRFIGKEKGKKAYIQANLHGAEIVGNAVIYQLIEFLQTLNENQIKGEICLIPVCNPVGVNQRTHFFSTGRANPYNGKDWNRIFWDYEKEKPDLDSFIESQIDLDEDEIRHNYLQQILTFFENKKQKALSNPRGIDYNKIYSYTLQSLCLNANYVIDIHSGSIETIDHLYCFQCRQKSAQYLLFDYAILMNRYDGDAFDEAFMKPWLALEAKFKERGRDIKFDVESWTLELGKGMTMNPNSVKKGINGIKNYLIYKEILQLGIKPTKKAIEFFPKYDLKDYYAVKGGMIKHQKKLGSYVKKGEKIYEILTFNKIGELPSIIEIKSEDNGLIYDMSSNESVNQGEYVLGIFPYV